MKRLPAPIDWTPPDCPLPMTKPLGSGFLIFALAWDGSLHFLQSDIQAEVMRWSDAEQAVVGQVVYMRDGLTMASARPIADHIEQLRDQGKINRGGVYRLDGDLRPAGFKGRLKTLLEPDPANLEPPRKKVTEEVAVMLPNGQTHITYTLNATDLRAD